MYPVEIKLGGQEASVIERVEEIKNDSARPIHVHLEPWGFVCALSPTKTLRVVARSSTEGSLEVVREGEVVIVYAWPGATAQAFEGSALVQDCGIPVPDVPKGLSIRGFLGLMFGSGKG